MGFVVSLLIIAVGAILTWGVNDTSSSVNLSVIGVVLMCVGLVGFILTLFFWESFWGPGYFRRTRYSAGAGTGPSELQVDLNHIQTVPQLFNSQLVPATTYHAIELVLDGSNAGTVVPTCLEDPSSLLEGCIASQISLSDPSQFLTTSSNEGISVPLNGLATLVININPVTSGVQAFPGRPGFSGGLYQFSPSISIPSVPNPLGLVTGAAFGASKVAASFLALQAWIGVH